MDFCRLLVTEAEGRAEVKLFFLEAIGQWKIKSKWVLKRQVWGYGGWFQGGGDYFNKMYPTHECHSFFQFEFVVELIKNWWNKKNSARKIGIFFLLAFAIWSTLSRKRLSNAAVSSFISSFPVHWNASCRREPWSSWKISVLASHTMEKNNVFCTKIKNCLCEEKLRNSTGFHMARD